MKNTDRKLATVRRIKSVMPITGSSGLFTLQIDGWKTITDLPTFKPGDLCLYCEIDSFVPDSDTRFSTFKNFVLRNSRATFDNGMIGIRLVSGRFHNHLSQGLALPISEFPEIIQEIAKIKAGLSNSGVSEAEHYDVIRQHDFSAMLGIKKYGNDRVQARLAGQKDHPAFIPQPIYDRAQNIEDAIFKNYKNTRFEITTKLDGESCTMYHYNGSVGVCSRDVEIDISTANDKNVHVMAATENNLLEALSMLGRNLALQGELIGPGIQHNREQLRDVAFYIYNIYDIDKQRYLSTGERIEVMDIFRADTEGYSILKHVPILHDSATLNELSITNIDELLKFADGYSLVHPVREGLVFKSCDGSVAFKCISNVFLERNRRRSDRG